MLNKPIYIKTIYYNEKINKEKVDLEISIQKSISKKYDFTPKIFNVLYYDDRCEISMENLEAFCVADKYGDQIENIPKNIIDEIHYIIRTLFEKEEIEYIDITPYNFIEKNNKVYIIDFGHSYYSNKENKKINWFLEEFLDGLDGWNPDFL